MTSHDSTFAAVMRQIFTLHQPNETTVVIPYKCSPNSHVVKHKEELHAPNYHVVCLDGHAHIAVNCQATTYCMLSIGSTSAIYIFKGKSG
jgi:hypothetical protein